jgi:hypothetical protein
MSHVAFTLFAVASSGSAGTPIVAGPKAAEVLALIHMVDRGESQLVEAELKGVTFISQIAVHQNYMRPANASDIPGSKSELCELHSVTEVMPPNKRTVRVSVKWKCICCDIIAPDRYFEFRGDKIRSITSIDIARIF